MLIRSRAPLRLGLAGGGTDLPVFASRFGGAVLNATIDLYSYTTIEPLDTGTVRIAALDLEQSQELEATKELQQDGVLDLHKAVYHRVVRDLNDGRPLSLSLKTYTDVPAGSGLGSSSTLVVSMVKAFVEWLNIPMRDDEIARLAYEIERIDLGQSGGQQDQYAASFGGFNFMEFCRDGRVIVNPLRIDSWIVSEFESSLVLLFTGVSRFSSDIIDEQTENLASQKSETIEAMMSLKREAFAMKGALLRGDLAGFGDCMRRSWASKKMTANRISTCEIDRYYTAALAHGARAGKVSGAGGGGFMAFLVDPGRRIEVIRALKAEGGEVIPCHFTTQGAEAWKISTR